MHKRVEKGGYSLPFVGIVSVAVVDKKRIAEAAIEVSIMIKVRPMAAHEHEKRALTVASAC